MADPGGTLAPSDKLKAHFTLIDVHSASLARVLIVLSLLGQILETRRNGDTERGIVLFATLFYVYNRDGHAQLLPPDVSPLPTRTGLYT